MVELEGYEADDLLATLTKYFRQEGNEVVIVTGDRDILQLVRDGVSVIMTRRGISDVIRYDDATVLERYGVTPKQWTDFVALKGETSDNLPGVPGVGDKTAAQLVNKYGDIEQVIAHADRAHPKAPRRHQRAGEPGADQQGAWAFARRCTAGYRSRRYSPRALG